MKTKVIVALLLSIVTASQPAFTTVRRKIPSDEPPQVTMVGVSADIARMAAVPTEPTLSPGGETVSVAMPFSSLQLNQSLVEYLGSVSYTHLDVYKRQALCHTRAAVIFTESSTKRTTACIGCRSS